MAKVCSDLSLAPQTFSKLNSFAPILHFWQKSVQKEVLAFN
jgi:hypothetical protein